MPQTDTPKSRWFMRETAALILIDHQIGTMQRVRNIASDAALHNAVLLAEAAKTLRMPIVMTASMEDHIQGRLLPDSNKSHPKHTKRASNGWASSTLGPILISRPQSRPPAASNW